ncbi:hypothetical protein BUALT_Bualt16G0103200 [Buddleja alternifolia]|uniref:Bifunctional lysine-specific demethylase and histidyl-hydroxylase n=1 Tax=Buddleja alternifolia TaxID=168488 RepID=A0AAV6WIT3_9LAMI|nr:hypothetical protein BUALT_Bualt16G0103200 [Buddleja alternifolia]
MAQQQNSIKFGKTELKIQKNNGFKVIADCPVDLQQQTLLDHFWSLKTIPEQNTLKHILCCALNFYFSKMMSKGKQSFTHYALYNGNKPGIYVNFENLSRQVESDKQKKSKLFLRWKGFYSFHEAFSSLQKNSTLSHNSLYFETFGRSSEASSSSDELPKKDRTEETLNYHKDRSRLLTVENNELQFKIADLMTEIEDLKKYKSQTEEILQNQEYYILDMEQQLEEFNHQKVLEAIPTEKFQTLMSLNSYVKHWFLSYLPTEITGKILRTAEEDKFWELMQTQNKLYDAYRYPDEYPGIRIFDLIQNYNNPLPLLGARAYWGYSTEETKDFDESRKDDGCQEFLLKEGDVLYIPRGFPHEARTGVDDDENVNGFSLHLTLAIEIEPPFEWEGFMHVALYCWSEKSKAFQCTSTDSLHWNLHSISVKLLHIAIKLIANLDPKLRKACLVGAILSSSDSKHSLHDNQIIFFKHLINMIRSQSNFSDTEHLEEAIQKNEDPLECLRWMKYFAVEGEIEKSADGRYAFDLLVEHRDRAEAVFMPVKSKFCDEVVFWDVEPCFKVLLEKYREVRKQYTSGMLSLHNIVDNEHEIASF